MGTLVPPNERIELSALQNVNEAANDCCREFLNGSALLTGPPSGHKSSFDNQMSAGRPRTILRSEYRWYPKRSKYKILGSHRRHPRSGRKPGTVRRRWVCQHPHWRPPQEDHGYHAQRADVEREPAQTQSSFGFDGVTARVAAT
jgi:hypothetical protein